MKPYFFDPLEFSAAEIVRKCKRGDVSQAMLLEQLIRGGISPVDVGTTIEDVFAYAREQAAAEARKTVEACRHDSAGPPNVLCLIECVESYDLDPGKDVGTTPGVLRRFAFDEAELVLFRCRGDHDLTKNALYLEFFLDPHRYCEEIHPETLGMRERDHQTLRTASVLRAMSCLEAIRNGTDDLIPHDALQREVDRHGLTRSELCMTPEEEGCLLR